MVVGITGNYCSGKDLACRIFERAGFHMINVDKIGHEALAVKNREIVDVFGKGMLRNGEIDRKKLGGVVFSDGRQKQMLERIVHPWMIKKVRKEVRECESCVVNAALLIEMCLFPLCDYVVGIDAPWEIAVERAVKREGLTPDEARMRLRAQKPLKGKLHFVDIVIDNSRTIPEFESRVREVVENLLRGT
jgi:dephospho-CoA kinase